MQATVQPAPCLSCSKPLKGRTDKKFCNDFCRNAFHNQQNSGKLHITRNINHTLMKNRSILNNFFRANAKAPQVKRDALINEGFIFKYSTHIQAGRTGEVYIFCYDLGYTMQADDKCRIIRQRIRS